MCCKVFSEPVEAFNLVEVGIYLLRGYNPEIEPADCATAVKSKEFLSLREQDGGKGLSCLLSMALNVEYAVIFFNLPWIQILDIAEAYTAVAFEEEAVSGVLQGFVFYMEALDFFEF